MKISRFASWEWTWKSLPFLLHSEQEKGFPGGASDKKKTAYQRRRR